MLIWNRRGAGLATPMSAGELAEIVRVAYDPAAARVLDEAVYQGTRYRLILRILGLLRRKRCGMSTGMIRVFRCVGRCLKLRVGRCIRMCFLGC